MPALTATEIDRLARSRGSLNAQAAVWSDALRDGNASPGLQAAFERWRAERPEHAAAFDALDHTYRMARLAGGAHAAQAMEAEIIHRARGQRRRRRQVGLAVAAGVVALVTGAAVLTGGSLDEARYLQAKLRYALAGDALYRTAVGERLAITLDDGSVVTLNTDSRAVVQYDEAARHIALLQGQALFEVAKDPAHPFIVTAGNHQVTALGTAFDIHLAPERFEVTLIEGKVEVAESAIPSGLPPVRRGLSSATGTADGSPASDSRFPIPGGAAGATSLTPHVLTAGQQLVAATTPSAGAASVVRQTDTARAVSWRNGQLIFEDDPLTGALAELNRYGRRQVVLQDPGLGELRVSGVFSTSNPNVFVNMLTLHFPIRILDISEDRIVLGRRS
ncbi:FecR family protein [Flagellatimonas centrodinii]|uniref:FecR family protein n=1 Tax=Flagellatimonas centrodinii TaxID=2806210 RepID=UPI0023BA758C|nr:FecR domain-containing protein [Flagellatimonas centrodinii]